MSEKVKMTTIALHQPNYLPWLGYFQKIYASDVFIFHDVVELNRRSFTQRVYIRNVFGQSETAFLSVPLKKYPRFERIHHLYPATEESWQVNHLNKIKQVYRKAPFFETYFPLLETWLLDAKINTLSLSELNIQLITNLLALLGIQRRLVKSSEMNFPLELKADFGIAWLVKQLNGTIYLSGEGAKKYQQEATYTAQNIQLKYSTYSKFLLENHPPQYQGEPLYGLSILDALFNMGAEGILNHFKQFDS